MADSATTVTDADGKVKIFSIVPSNKTEEDFPDRIR